MSELKRIVSEIERVFKEKQLPGIEAQIKMAPNIRKSGIMNGIPNVNPIRSSVLILIYPAGNKFKTVFILRPKYDGVHSGQIALPGGKVEENDKNLIDTALRETKEEIGVENIRVLGCLSEIYIPPSNNLVQPVVGFVSMQPNFKANTREVDEIIEVYMNDFFNGKIPVEFSKFNTTNKNAIEAPCYRIGSNLVWGATAMIISELIEFFKETYVFKN